MKDLRSAKRVGTWLRTARRLLNSVDKAPAYMRPVFMRVNNGQRLTRHDLLVQINHAKKRLSELLNEA